MILNIPVTATSVPEWVRKTATAFNELLRQFYARVSALETSDTAQNGRLDTLDAHDADHETRLASAEASITTLQTYTASSFTLTPGTLPGSPTAGMIAFDSADNKHKGYDGTTWNALY